MRNGSTDSATAQDALDQMSQAVAIFDATPKLVYCNPAARKLLHLSAELARPGTSFRRLMSHQIESGALAASELPRLLKAIRQKRPLRLEYRDSSGMIVAVRRDPIADGGFVVLYNDVTQQRRAEVALQENERRYHDIVENQADLIARFTTEGTITFVNGAFCRFYRLARDKILGCDILDFVAPDDRAKLGAHFRGLGHGKKQRETEHRASLGADGLPRWLHRFDRPILGPGNDVVEVQSVMRDVTELRRVQEHAHRTNKLMTLGQIVAGVTHELNQPLNAAALAAQNALIDIEERGAIDVSYTVQKLSSLAGSLTRMGSIVNHLRSFVRPPAQSDVATDVPEIVRRSVEFVAGQTDFDAIDFVTRLPQTCRLVAAPPVDLEIVLVNLFTNARDAIARQARERRGRIVIAVKDEPRRPAVRLRVSDNGGGIPHDLIPRVFDPFFTTKDAGAGMGLGLAIVHQTVTNLGGTLAVRNARGGASFTITVPVAR